MFNRRFVGQRAVAIAGALALSVPLATVSASPASAADCKGGFDESATVTCNRGGGSGGRPIDTNWRYLRKWADASCPQTGVRGSAVRPGTTGPVSTFCLRNNAGTPGLTATARANVPAPTLKTDYKRAFLTGAKVTFDVGQNNNGTDFEDKWVELEEFNNVWLHLQPERFKIDFGDGSPSSEWDVNDSDAKSKYEHVFSKTSNEATITLTVWWSGFVHGNLARPDPNAPPIDPNDPGAGIESLGQIDRTSTLTRPVVEVWSALTEPTN